MSQGSSDESVTVLRLYSSCLLSKWGFNDGDTPESVYDYCDAHSIDYGPFDWHAALVSLVRSYLLPALDQDVEVYEIETIHNPIRARTDGRDIESVTLTPEYIDVPMPRVIELLLSSDSSEDK